MPGGYVSQYAVWIGSPGARSADAAADATASANGCRKLAGIRLVFPFRGRARARQIGRDGPHL
jgi:hypothetical protein